jgi:hypothetical protein
VQIVSRYVCLILSMWQTRTRTTDLFSIYVNDVLVRNTFRCGLALDMLSSDRTLGLILVVVTGGLLKPRINWAVFTSGIRAVVPCATPLKCDFILLLPQPHRNGIFHGPCLGPHTNREWKTMEGGASFYGVR